MKKMIAAMALFAWVMAGTASAEVSADLAWVMSEWARIKYELPASEREAAFERLVERAHRVTAAHIGQAEPLVWEAIVRASLAGEAGAFGGALGLVKEARALLEEAERLQPDALDGSVYTSLGSLYYQVPGWPLGFGDDDRARSYLEKALAINPDGIDANYFFGDFLLQQGDYEGAVTALETAMRAPERPGRSVADAGRRSEVAVALATARRELGKSSAR